MFLQPLLVSGDSKASFLLERNLIQKVKQARPLDTPSTFLDITTSGFKLPELLTIAPDLCSKSKEAAFELVAGADQS